MKDLFKKGLLVGLGVAEFTRETLSKAIDELEKKGEVSKGQAKKIMDSFSTTAKKRRKEMETQIDKTISTFLGKMNIATEDRLKKLDTRLRSMEKKLKAKK